MQLFCNNIYCEVNFFVSQPPTWLVPLLTLPKLLFCYFSLTSFSHGETQTFWLCFPYKDFGYLFVSLVIAYTLNYKVNYPGILQKAQSSCLKKMMLLNSAVIEPDSTDFMYVFPTGQWSHFESFKSVLEERGKERISIMKMSELTFISPDTPALPWKYLMLLSDMDVLWYYLALKGLR